jgi:uncharacterized membrane protein
MAGMDGDERMNDVLPGLGMSVGRLEAFSDGVLAIVITLLILEIKVLNLILLLPVTVLPWPTALLAEYTHEGTVGDRRVAVLVYGVTSSAMAASFNLLWRYLLRHPELHKPQVSAELLAVRNRRYTAGLAAYPVATLLGLVSVPLFLALMLGLAVLYLLPTPDVRT